MGSVSKTVSKITMKVICLLLVLVAAASACETCGKKGSDSRIINGVDAGHGEFPWQISLRFGRYGHICGGTLIGKQHVLCAAHCFGQTMKPKNPVDLSGPYAGLACMPAAGKDYRGHSECQLSGWGLVKRWPQTLADRLRRSLARSGLP